ncbi:MAG: hypothetical protein ACRBCT_07790 [Alphaproteobacteria bacterium]
MSVKTKPRAKIRQQGKVGEKQFENWLNEHNFGFIAVQQNKDDLAHAFVEHVKRPDHLLLIPQIGFIAVDVKNKKLSKDCFTMDIDGEIAKALEFERLFSIYLWYAFKDKDADGEEWHFISAYDAMTYGKERKNPSNGKRFLAIPVARFRTVSNMDDFQKLFSGRVGTVGTITRMVDRYFNTKDVKLSA